MYTQRRSSASARRGVRAHAVATPSLPTQHTSTLHTNNIDATHSDADAEVYERLDFDSAQDDTDTHTLSPSLRPRRCGHSPVGTLNDTIGHATLTAHDVERLVRTATAATAAAATTCRLGNNNNNNNHDDNNGGNNNVLVSTTPRLPPLTTMQASADDDDDGGGGAARSLRSTMRSGLLDLRQTLKQRQLQEQQQQQQQDDDDKAQALPLHTRLPALAKRDVLTTADMASAAARTRAVLQQLSLLSSSSSRQQQQQQQQQQHMLSSSSSLHRLSYTTNMDKPRHNTPTATATTLTLAHLQERVAAAVFVCDNGVSACSRLSTCGGDSSSSSGSASGRSNGSDVTTTAALTPSKARATAAAAATTTAQPRRHSHRRRRGSKTTTMATTTAGQHDARERMRRYVSYLHGPPVTTHDASDQKKDVVVDSNSSSSAAAMLSVPSRRARNVTTVTTTAAAAAALVTAVSPSCDDAAWTRARRERVVVQRAMRRVQQTLHAHMQQCTPQQRLLHSVRQWCDRTLVDVSSVAASARSVTSVTTATTTTTAAASKSVCDDDDDPAVAHERVMQKALLQLHRRDSSDSSCGCCTGHDDDVSSHDATTTTRAAAAAPSVAVVVVVPSTSHAAATTATSPTTLSLSLLQQQQHTAYCDGVEAHRALCVQFDTWGRKQQQQQRQRQQQQRQGRRQQRCSNAETALLQLAQCILTDTAAHTTRHTKNKNDNDDGDDEGDAMCADAALSPVAAVYLREAPCFVDVATLRRVHGLLLCSANTATETTRSSSSSSCTSSSACLPVCLHFARAGAVTHTTAHADAADLVQRLQSHSCTTRTAAAAHDAAANVDDSDSNDCCMRLVRRFVSDVAAAQSLTVVFACRDGATHAAAATTTTTTTSVQLTRVTIDMGAVVEQSRWRCDVLWRSAAAAYAQLQQQQDAPLRVCDKRNTAAATTTESSDNTHNDNNNNEDDKEHNAVTRALQQHCVVVCAPATREACYTACSVPRAHAAAHDAVALVQTTLVPTLHRLRDAYARACALATHAQRDASDGDDKTTKKRQQANADEGGACVVLRQWTAVCELLALETAYAHTVRRVVVAARRVARYNAHVSAYMARKAQQQRVWGAVYVSALRISYVLCKLLAERGIEHLPEHYVPLLRPAALFVGCHGGQHELRARLPQMLIALQERAKRVRLHLEAMTWPDDAHTLLDAAATQAAQHGGSGAARVLSCLASEDDVRYARLACVPQPLPRLLSLVTSP